MLQTKCFHIDAMPYELEYKILPERYVKKRILDSIIDEFQTQISRNGPSLTNFKEYLSKQNMRANLNKGWSSHQEPKVYTKGEKLIATVKKTFQLNRSLLEHGELRWKDFGNKFRYKIGRAHV